MHVEQDMVGYMDCILMQFTGINIRHQPKWPPTYPPQAITATKGIFFHRVAFLNVRGLSEDRSSVATNRFHLPTSKISSSENVSPGEAEGRQDGGGCMDIDSVGRGSHVQYYCTCHILFN